VEWIARETVIDWLERSRAVWSGAVRSAAEREVISSRQAAAASAAPTSAHFGGASAPPHGFGASVASASAIGRLRCIRCSELRFRRLRLRLSQIRWTDEGRTTAAEEEVGLRPRFAGRRQRSRGGE
jgi:hypothetical protein